MAEAEASLSMDDALYAVHVEVVDLLDIDFKSVENEYRQTGFGAQVALGDVGKNCSDRVSRFATVQSWGPTRRDSYFNC